MISPTIKASSNRGMRLSILAVICLVGGIVIEPAQAVVADTLAITDAQALSAGKHLWKNECAGTVEGLTSWNTGEDFASLGIGHFIWYPRGRRGPFEESFPELVGFLAHEKVALPAWLSATEACPWNSRAEFLADRNGPRLSELRVLLSHTVAQQARFCANRLEAALPKILGSLPEAERDRVKQQFYRVAASPNGVYALVDYVNFKGEGVLPTERYQGKGWGLLQVLAGMTSNPASGPGATATSDYAASASRVLTERVANAPAERRESRWLPGWKSRIESYSAGG